MHHPECDDDFVAMDGGFVGSVYLALGELVSMSAITDIHGRVARVRAALGSAGVVQVRFKRQ